MSFAGVMGTEGITVEPPTMLMPGLTGGGTMPSPIGGGAPGSATSRGAVDVAPSMSGVRSESIGAPPRSQFWEKAGSGPRAASATMANIAVFAVFIVVLEPAGAKA